MRLSIGIEALRQQVTVHAFAGIQSSDCAYRYVNHVNFSDCYTTL